MCQSFDPTYTHMPQSKSWGTCQVHFSCTKTFYPPAAYSPPNRNTFSNCFKMLLFNMLWLRMISNCASVSMACKLNSNINKSLANYYLFISINTKSIKHPQRLQLFIGCIGAKCCRGCLCEYCYQGYWHDQCKSFALPVIIYHDCWQIVLSATDTSEINFGDILLPPPSMPPAQSINQATTSSDSEDDFNILWLKSPSTLAGYTPDWGVLWLDTSPNEVLIQSQCLLTLLIRGKVNTPRTSPEVPTDTWLSGRHDSSAHLAAYKATCAASYQAALSPTHQYIQPSLNIYPFYREMVGNIQQWTPSPLIICNTQWAILRAHGDLDALVTIWQGQSEINISLDNIINNLSSSHL